MARTNNSALIAELVNALQTNLAPYAPARLNVAPPALRTAASVDSTLGTNLNRSRQDILNELLANIDAAYKASMSDQTDSERAYIQALANVSDSALDTLRNQYAGDTAIGANRGMQAANALSAILGMQGNSIEGVNELFGNRSTLLNQRATDTANAATEASNLYATLQQYLADYAKSLYETDSTNHTTELASWNAYIDALMSAIPELSYYNNITNGGNSYTGGGYTGSYTTGGDEGYVYPSNINNLLTGGTGNGNTGTKTPTVSSLYNVASPATTSPNTAAMLANALGTILPNTGTVGGVGGDDDDDDSRPVHGGGSRRDGTGGRITYGRATSDTPFTIRETPSGSTKKTAGRHTITGTKNMSRVPTYTGGVSTPLRTNDTYTLASSYTPAASANPTLRTGNPYASGAYTPKYSQFTDSLLANSAPASSSSTGSGVGNVTKTTNRTLQVPSKGAITDALNNALGAVRNTANAGSAKATNPASTVNSTTKKTTTKPTVKNKLTTIDNRLGGTTKNTGSTLGTTKKTTTKTTVKNNSKALSKR